MQIAPAHDPNDFEVGRRHNLQFINIFTDDGKINSNGGAQFEGMPRFTARICVIEALKLKVLMFCLIILSKMSTSPESLKYSYCILMAWYGFVCVVKHGELIKSIMCIMSCLWDLVMGIHS
jgi:hypothetical protein